MADSAEKTIIDLLDEVGKTDDPEIRMMRLKNAKAIVRKVIGKGTPKEKAPVVPKVSRVPKKAVQKTKPAVSRVASEE